MTTALIIIDMQCGSFTDSTLRYDADGLVKRLNTLSAAVRASGGIVIFMQHDGPDGDPHHPDLPGWKLLPDLDSLAEDIVVRKASCDSFLNTSLDGLLKYHGVERLIITGCATDYCVDTTIRSALGRGYPTVVPMDGHTTSTRPHLTAEKIIEHHNAIWADFIAPGGPAVICRCSEVLPA